MQIKMLWLRRALVAFLIVALPIPAVARLPQDNAPVEQRKSVAGGTPASIAEVEDYAARELKEATKLEQFEGGQIFYIAVGLLIALLIVLLILLLR
jgi:hypothetical protein